MHKTVQTARFPGIELRPRDDRLPAYSPFRISQVKGPTKIPATAASDARAHQKETAGEGPPHGQRLRRTRVRKARAVVALGRELEAYPGRCIEAGGTSLLV